VIVVLVDVKINYGHIHSHLDVSQVSQSDPSNTDYAASVQMSLKHWFSTQS
jgi:hypothetical protein